MQNDLISRQSLMAHFETSHALVNDRDVLYCNGVLDVIAREPSVDAVPVVRCRECKYYKPKGVGTPGSNPMRCNHPCLDYDEECYDQWLDVEPDDYCKYGERKMDAQGMDVPTKDGGAEG